MGYICYIEVITRPCLLLSGTSGRRAMLMCGPVLCVQSRSLILMVMDGHASHLYDFFRPREIHMNHKNMEVWFR